MKKSDNEGLSPVQNGPALPLYQNPLTGRCPFHAACGRMGPFGDHWHGEMEILYLLPESDPMTVTADGAAYLLNAQDAFFCSSTVVYAVTKTLPATRALVLEMGFPLLGADFSVFARQRYLTPLIHFGDGKASPLSPLEEIFQSIPTERIIVERGQLAQDSAAGIASRMRISAGLFRIAAILAEAMPMAEVSAERARKMQAMMAVQTVLSYVREHYSRPITLESAATLTGYEKTRFCQLFREAVGIPFHRYLTGRRMDAAYAMLKETDLSVGAVGEAVGIPEPKIFSRLVRQTYGISPRELRNGEKDKAITSEQEGSNEQND